ncbi:antibiotic biosynthesis monooxygenase family protein [Glutamicibacter sp. NPDC087344]|uniref:antibiotic biosynthesis monooxygenase family protein n=1 Tax=Glutamicibacter sp. NPDC087344 TaxID=3363994 RepID=UPI00382ACAEF
MIFEVATIKVLPGHEQAFEQAALEAIVLFQQAAGALSMTLNRVVESTSTYELRVGWETVEHHTEHFRSSQAYGQWRQLIGDHLDGAPAVVHTTHVLNGF